MWELGRAPPDLLDFCFRGYDEWHNETCREDKLMPLPYVSLADRRRGDLGLTRFLAGDIIRRQAERSKLNKVEWG